MKAQTQAWMTEANRVKMKRISQEHHPVQMSVPRNLHLPQTPKAMQDEGYHLAWLSQGA